MNLLKNEELAHILKAFATVLLSSVYPLLYLYTANINVLEFPQVFPTMITICVGSLILAGLLSIVFRNISVGTSITCVIIILVFFYGHIYEELVINNLKIRHRVLLTIWGLVFIVSSLIFIRRKTVAKNIITPFLVVFGTLVIFSIFNIQSFYAQATTVSKNDFIQYLDANDIEVEVDPLPDVYYIVLDRYTRDDIIKDYLDLDISPFIDSLEDMGFYVADQSFSNYPNTRNSIPSTVNMIYLEDFALSIGADVKDERPLQRLLKNNAVAANFKTLGYEYHLFYSWWSTGADWADVDYYYHPYENNFKRMLYKTTILNPLQSENIFSKKMCPTILSTPFDLGCDKKYYENTERRFLSELPNIARQEQPTFAFVHIISPHDPYTLAPPDQNNYVGEVQELNKLLLETLGQVIALSDIPPIIIMGGDHGLFASTIEEVRPITDLTAEQFLETRYAILNTYLVPPEIRVQLYPSISPVNSFRLVFNYLVNPDMELLPDKSYREGANDKPYDHSELPPWNISN